MHNFKDLGGIAVVAGKKSAEVRQIEQAKARIYGPEKPVSQGFTNPTANVRAMGIDIGMKVGDFGAGSGAYTIAAARAVGHSGKVYAVDIQKDLLVRIKNLTGDEGMDWVEIIWGDFETLGGSRIADASLDTVILSNVLFQLEHLPPALAEIHRVLKPSGRLAIIDWTDSFGGLGPEQKRVVTKMKALEFTNAAGFSLLKEFPAGDHHYGLLVRKGAQNPLKTGS